MYRCCVAHPVICMFGGSRYDIRVLIGHAVLSLAAAGGNTLEANPFHDSRMQSDCGVTSFASRNLGTLSDDLKKKMSLICLVIG